MWGDIVGENGWLTGFVDAAVDLLRGWFSFLNPSENVEEIVYGSQISFIAWVEDIVLPALKGLLDWT